MQDWKEYANVVTALFVIVDPVAAVPVYISLMRQHSPEEKRRTPRLAALTVAIVLVTAALIGESLLTFFRSYARVETFIKKGIESPWGGKTLCLSRCGYTSWLSCIFPGFPPV